MGTESPMLDPVHGQAYDLYMVNFFHDIDSLCLEESNFASNNRSRLDGRQLS